MTDFTKKTKEELLKLIAEKKEGIKNFRFGLAGSKIKNLREGRNLRREIAQIMTSLKSVDNQ